MTPEQAEFREYVRGTINKRGFYSNRDILKEAMGVFVRKEEFPRELIENLISRLDAVVNE